MARYDSDYSDGVKSLLDRSQYPPMMVQLLAKHLGRANAAVYRRLAGSTKWDLNDIYPIMEFLEQHRIVASLPEVLEHMLIDRNRRTEGGSE